MNDYEDFSKQDLFDRRNALLSEWHDLREQKQKVADEIRYISELLEEIKWVKEVMSGFLLVVIAAFVIRR